MNAPTPVGALDRTTYLGGSDVAAILGVSPWTTPFMLFQKKVGAHVEELTPAKRRILERGARWEPIVLEMLVDELTDRGHDVEVVATGQRYQDPEFPFLAAEIDAELVPMGSAGVKVMSVVRDIADAYVHAGGQYQWDNAAPVAVARAAGLYCSRVDGSPLVYNEEDTSLPDLIVCRPELAEQIVEFVKRYGVV